MSTPLPQKQKGELGKRIAHQDYTTKNCRLKTIRKLVVRGCASPPRMRQLSDTYNKKVPDLAPGELLIWKKSCRDVWTLDLPPQGPQERKIQQICITFGDTHLCILTATALQVTCFVFANSGFLTDPRHMTEHRLHIKPVLLPQPLLCPVRPRAQTQTGVCASKLKMQTWQKLPFRCTQGNFTRNKQAQLEL